MTPDNREKYASRCFHAAHEAFNINKLMEILLEVEREAFLEAAKVAYSLLDRIPNQTPMVSAWNNALMMVSEKIREKAKGL